MGDEGRTHHEDAASSFGRGLLCAARREGMKSAMSGDGGIVGDSSGAQIEQRVLEGEKTLTGKRERCDLHGADGLLDRPSAVGFGLRREVPERSDEGRARLRLPSGTIRECLFDDGDVGPRCYRDEAPEDETVIRKATLERSVALGGKSRLVLRFEAVVDRLHERVDVARLDQREPSREDRREVFRNAGRIARDRR